MLSAREAIAAMVQVWPAQSVDVVNKRRLAHRQRASVVRGNIIQSRAPKVLLVKKDFARTQICTHVARWKAGASIELVQLVGSIGQTLGTFYVTIWLARRR